MSERLVDIYLITNKLNGKKYVGKTSRGYKKRFYEHCNGVEFGTYSYISNAIRKYGKENFEVELIKQVPESEWKYWETYYIKKFQTLYTQNGYNITKGGDDNPMNDPEIRKKHLNAVRNPERLKRVSEKLKGRVISEETRKKISENNRRNIERITSGFRRYNKSRQIQVAIVDENDNILKIFESLADAAEFAGGSRRDSGNINRYADKYNKNGKRAKFLGYMWTKQI